jgi:hypothetical protein
LVEDVAIDDDDEGSNGGGKGGILKPSLSIVVAGSDGGFFFTFGISSGDNFRFRGDDCCSVFFPLV